MDKKYFFITGLPRSRTAWLSVLLTQGNSFCFHELPVGRNMVDTIAQKMGEVDYPCVGVSEPSLLVCWRELQKRFPHARWVVVDRAPKESLEAFRKAMPFEIPDINVFVHEKPKLIAELNRNYNIFSVDYNGLSNFDTCSQLVRFCTEGKLDCQRWAVLDELNITQDVEKAIQHYTPLLASVGAQSTGGK